MTSAIMQRRYSLSCCYLVAYVRSRVRVFMKRVPSGEPETFTPSNALGWRFYLCKRHTVNAPAADNRPNLERLMDTLPTHLCYAQRVAPLYYYLSSSVIFSKKVAKEKR